MIELLGTTAGLLGVLIITLGLFFVYAAFVDTKPTPVKSRRRLSGLLGLLLIAIGVNNIVTYYTGGPVAFIEHGGELWWAQLAFWARASAVVVALALVIDALGVWNRKG